MCGSTEKLAGERWWGCSSPWWNHTALAALVLLVPPTRNHTAECRQGNTTCSQWRNLERMVFWYKKDWIVLFFSSTQVTKISLVLFPATLHVKLKTTAAIERGLRPARKSLRSWQSMAGQHAARHWSAMSSGSCWSYFPVTRGSTSEWRLPATRLRYSLVMPQASEASSSLTMDFWKVIVVLVFC